MEGVSVFILGFLVTWGSAQFLNNRPFPTYSLENMPDTEFTCRDKILGGYYADAETQCQMFHVCVKVAGVGVQDFRFLCPNGTAFDQDHQICADWEDVDCDATTLYYSSDNFDLYRIGSGFESKAVKYGEDEETFALQRAETGDARLNREHQAQRVNQQREPNNQYYSRPHQKSNQNHNNNNNEKDIFKGSSSSNFFNNRNNGKENDDDYDDNVNVNQDRDFEQKRKIVRKQQRRPVQNQNNERQNNQNRNQNNQNQHIRRPQAPQQQQNLSPPKPQPKQNVETPTQRPQQRPTGFINNFAGSSYIPTTSRPSSTTINNEQYSNAVNNYNNRNGNGNGRQRANSERQYSNADDFRQNSPTPTYTVSTPAPFRQTQYNNPPARPTITQQPTTVPPRNFNNQNFNANYDVQKVKQTKQTENYPTTTNPQNYNNFEVTKVKPSKPAAQKTTPFDQTDNYPSNNPQFNKKQTTPFKQNENYPTTFSPQTKQFNNNNNNQRVQDNFPTTFAPRTNAGYTQISQQTTQYFKNNQNTQQYQNQNNQKSTPQQPTTFHNQFNKQAGPQTTPKAVTFTQYTPTVPKITQTTPVARSNRFDETQYDDGSYNPKHDYDGDRKEDEFLKTAHSQNIASSRNEFAKTTKNAQQFSQPTQKPYYESPRPFSVSPNTPKVTPKQQVTDYPRSTQVNNNNNNKAVSQPQSQPQAPPKPTVKKVKDYDYAYYDTNSGSEPDYEIDTEFKKSTVKN